jgi:hypothetical protein
VASFTGDRSVPISDYSAKITWGDGSTGKGRVVNGTLGNYLVQASHVYGKQGNYTMTVRVSSTTGVVAQSINRVSVFTASVCPKRSATRGRNCLGQIAFAPGCVIAGAKLEVNIPSSASIKQVSYAIDGSRKVIRGTGPHFRAGLPTAGLRDGTHQLTARVTFRSGRPRTVNKNRPFAVC